MNGKKLIHSNKIKYLGILLDENLSGNEHCLELSKKLNRANGILAKARHFVPFPILKNIYHATFSSNLFYGTQVWGLTTETARNKISLLQKKAVRIMTFTDFQEHFSNVCSS